MDQSRVVVFAEEDTLFSLMAIALTRAPLERGVQALHYFFGPDISAPLARLTAMADRLGLAPATEAVICAGRDELLAEAGRAHVIVAEMAEIDRAVLDAAGPNLGLIQKFGRDAGNIDLAAAQGLGIPVETLKRRSSVSSAEHVVLLILALARRLVAANASVRARRDPSREAAFSDGAPTTNFNYTAISGIRLLSESTLGLIGLGENAGEVAKRAVALGMQVVYFKRTRLSPSEEEALGGVSYLPREDLLARADFVSIHVPYGPATEKMVGAAFLAAMKQGAYLVNSSRGAIVDERALYEAIRSGHLAGAGLDVYRHEPIPPDSPLLDLDEVVWTPHMAGGEPSFMLDEVEAVLTNIAAAWDGGNA